MKYSHVVISPGGNDTALVIGNGYAPNEKKFINDSIMRDCKNVEQVGFLNPDKYELTMAGGEFCGNATRSAAWYYLNGKYGEIEISVSGVDRKLKAGVGTDGFAWAEMPIYKDISCIKMIDDEIYLVKLEGIVHIVIRPKVSKKYIESKLDIRNIARDILRKYSLMEEPAAGVIFMESLKGGLKIHPCVRVCAIDTLFYETACGSGTTAVGLVEAYLNGGDVDFSILQPSGKQIIVNVTYRKGHFLEARISGPIEVRKKTMEDGYD